MFDVEEYRDLEI